MCSSANPYRRVCLYCYVFGINICKYFRKSIKYSTLTETLNKIENSRSVGIVTRWTLREPIRFYSPTSVVGFLIEFLLLRRPLVLACCRLFLLCLPCLPMHTKWPELLGNLLLNAWTWTRTWHNAIAVDRRWPMVSLIVDSEYAVQECQRFLYVKSIPLSAIKIKKPTRFKYHVSIAICLVNYKRDQFYPSLVKILL